MSTGVSFTLEPDGQKSGGVMPPQSEKWRGHCHPGSVTYVGEAKILKGSVDKIFKKANKQTKKNTINLDGNL